ncbi:unnamed protein product [Ectocarpus sp. 12 AP-2014]
MVDTPQTTWTSSQPSHATTMRIKEPPLVRESPRVAEWSEEHGWRCRMCEHMFGNHTEGIRQTDVDRHEQGKRHSSAVKPTSAPPPPSKQPAVAEFGTKDSRGQWICSCGERLATPSCAENVWR